jgi:hypothetical protein
MYLDDIFKSNIFSTRSKGSYILEVGGGALRTKTFVYVKPKIHLILVHPKILKIEKKFFQVKRIFKATLIAKMFLQIFEVLLQKIFP